MLPAILEPMKQGGYRKAAGGFTIIETLIVLAVTGVLFVSAVLLINGRQARAEFQTGINDLQQQLQQVINETASGFYPNNGTFSCSQGMGGGAPVITIPHTGGNAQGTNLGCIFLGKAVQFGMQGTGYDNSSLGFFPIVGNQNDSTGNPVQTLVSAVPRAAYPTSASDMTPISLLATAEMEYGLSIATANSTCSVGGGGMCYVGLTPPNGSAPAPVSTGIAAFVAGDNSGQIATPDPTGGTGLQSGAEQLSLYGVTTSALNEAPSSASSAVTATNLVAASAVYICVASATTNQSGLFTISGDGSLGVTLQIMSGTTCSDS